MTKEYVVEAMVNGMDVGVAIEIPMFIVDAGPNAVIQHILAQDYLTDIGGQVIVFPKQFNMMAAYPMVRKPSLVEVPPEE